MANKHYQIPGIGVVAFPDSMSATDIDTAAGELYRQWHTEQQGRNKALAAKSAQPTAEEQRLDRAARPVTGHMLNEGSPFLGALRLYDRMGRQSIERGGERIGKGEYLGGASDIALGAAGAAAPFVLPAAAVAAPLATAAGFVAAPLVGTASAMMTKALGASPGGVELAGTVGGFAGGVGGGYGVGKLGPAAYAPMARGLRGAARELAPTHTTTGRVLRWAAEKAGSLLDPPSPAPRRPASLSDDALHAEIAARLDAPVKAPAAARPTAPVASPEASPSAAEVAARLGPAGPGQPDIPFQTGIADASGRPLGGYAASRSPGQEAAYAAAERRGPGRVTSTDPAAIYAAARADRVKSAARFSQDSPPARDNAAMRQARTAGPGTEPEPPAPVAPVVEPTAPRARPTGPEPAPAPQPSQAELEAVAQGAVTAATRPRYPKAVTTAELAQRLAKGGMSPAADAEMVAAYTAAFGKVSGGRQARRSGKQMQLDLASIRALAAQYAGGA